jgi:hypothetical protein
MSDTDQEWHDKAVNGGLRDALAVMVVRQGKQEEAEASMRLQLAAKDREIAALQAALRRHMIVVDDWMHIYAPDMCDDDRVKEAQARAHSRGTLAYIAEAQDDARTALGSPCPRPTPPRPCE